MISSIFISKNKGELSQLEAFAKDNKMGLQGHSFLKFEPLDFEVSSDYDIIFFGSPRAAKFFQSSYAIPKSTLIASVGGKTTQVLKTLGYTVAFNGEGVGSISEVAETFKKWVNDRTVLFPVSTRSLGTISSKISASQCIHVECYKTHVIGKKIDHYFDTYVFTSPSNVNGFFKDNSIPKDSSVIAWGCSTETSLKEYHTGLIDVLKEPTEEALIRSIQAKNKGTR